LKNQFTYVFLNNSYSYYKLANQFLFNVHGSVHYRKNILTYIQQDTSLHSLFYLMMGGGTTRNM